MSSNPKICVLLAYYKLFHLEQPIKMIFFMLIEVGMNAVQHSSRKIASKKSKFTIFQDFHHIKFLATLAGNQNLLKIYPKNQSTQRAFQSPSTTSTRIAAWDLVFSSKFRKVVKAGGLWFESGQRTFVKLDKFDIEFRFSDFFGPFCIYK